ncbi:MAG TPA: S8 family serine peptidase, partial [Candidatus Pacearchaeota archaeon]|nr:S8 family serine peptidase [Candidatus Pacearchaeota archaeon]
MRNKSFIVYTLIFFILISTLIPILAKNDKKIMILEKDTNYSKVGTFNNQKYNEKLNYGVVRVTEQEIEEIKRDKSVKIREPFKVKVFLDDAVSIQNVTNSWKLTANQMNLTGQSQSVCVLDTGADPQHPDLQEKIVAQHCFCELSDCCPNGLNEDTNATDDNGHGTHVAGIIAAQGNLLGIARQANLVVMKVMDFEGSGNEVDLISAINWCTENSEEYNISVISMSLGADCDLNPDLCSQSTCEGLSPVLQEEIDSAIAKNISVVIATGNEYNYTHIAWPSCHSGVTRVGSSDKTDLNISNFTNRNSLLNLLAVGDSINSTMPRYDVYLNTEYSYPQNYSEMSGTSMATPMVSGAIAILKQYLNLSGQSKTPSQIETVLNNTGKRIYDSQSGLNYSRIDVYSALLSLDRDSPDITIASPQNNSNSSLNYQNFSCNVSDWQLKNITLNVYNSTALINQTSWSISGKSNSTSLNLTNLNLDRRYYWNYLIYDEKNNVLTTQNYTFYLSNLNVQQISPRDDTHTNVNETYFVCNSSAPESLQLSN